MMAWGKIAARVPASFSKLNKLRATEKAKNVSSDTLSLPMLRPSNIPASRPIDAPTIIRPKYPKFAHASAIRPIAIDAVVDPSDV